LVLAVKTHLPVTSDNPFLVADRFTAHADHENQEQLPGVRIFPFPLWDALPANPGRGF
jgi:hypothetical protein